MIDFGNLKWPEADSDRLGLSEILKETERNTPGEHGPVSSGDNPPAGKKCASVEDTIGKKQMAELYAQNSSSITPDRIDNSLLTV